MHALKPSTAVILLFLLAFPNVVGTFSKAASHPFKNFSLLSNFESLSQDGLGLEETVPHEAVEVKRLAAKHHIDGFFLSDGLTKDDFLFQRILETLYPLQPSVESPFVFFKTGEDILSGCDLLDETTVVKLARCG